MYKHYNEPQGKWMVSPGDYVVWNVVWYALQRRYLHYDYTNGLNMPGISAMLLYYVCQCGWYII